MTLYMENRNSPNSWVFRFEMSELNSRALLDQLCHIIDCVRIECACMTKSYQKVLYSQICRRFKYLELMTVSSPLLGYFRHVVIFLFCFVSQVIGHPGTGIGIGTVARCEDAMHPGFALNSSAIGVALLNSNVCLVPRCECKHRETQRKNFKNVSLRLSYLAFRLQYLEECRLAFMRECKICDL